MENKAIERLRNDGWCVVPEVIPADTVGLIRDSVAATVAANPNPNVPPRIGHLTAIVNHDQSLTPYLAHPSVMDLVRVHLGDHARISFTTATINHPGNDRGGWHADWPFNQRNAGHIPEPYPDIRAHLTTLWMLSPFTADNGATLILPGSHRTQRNPTGDNELDPSAQHPDERHAEGDAGSVLMMDSRMWHATAANSTAEARVSVVVRYAAWWLNLEILRPGSAERTMMADERGKTDNVVPPVPLSVFQGLDADVQPLFRHWVEEDA